ncbi:MAG: PIG-L family deacetylase [Candidatus ainarchaeum sp.]|nr:PIG-L family deacetylase [Candidatus ainarchaeum sp.]
MVRALMVVAHPDDETIWAGGLLQRKKNWNWTIASLCRSSDSDRKPKFEKVCGLYNAESVIFDLEDTLLDEIKNEIVQKLLLPFEKRDFDFIFTHGENGEYGHIRHKDAHRAVLALAKEKKLNSKKLFVFSYKKGKQFELVPDGKETKKIVLSKKELDSKKKIVAEIYGYAFDSPDVQYCTATEAFREVVFK